MIYLKILTWNCNRAFRKKYKNIKLFNADIYIIQECENPYLVKDNEFNKFASNYIWTGNKNKGLGIFVKDKIRLINNYWDTFGLEWFISCTINETFTLIGILGSGNYIEDIYTYLKIYETRMKELRHLLIGGDFNSNIQWDKKHKRRSHSAVLHNLTDLGLVSCYHNKLNEAQGMEIKPTFYLHKNKEKSYHIDYIVYYRDKIKAFEIGDFDDWISLSDHMPMIVDIDE